MMGALVTGAALGAAMAAQQQNSEAYAMSLMNRMNYARAYGGCVNAEVNHFQESFHTRKPCPYCASARRVTGKHFIERCESCGAP